MGHSIRRGRTCLGAGLLLLLSPFVCAQQTLPYFADFESSATLGSLPPGWTADPPSSAFVEDTVAKDGAQALEITTGAAVNQTFTDAPSIVWIDGWQKGEPSNVYPDLSALSSGTAIVAFRDTGIFCLNGDGLSSGTWRNTSVVPTSGTWYRVTLKLNYAPGQKKYDCYVNGVLRLSGLGFFSNGAESNQLHGFQASAGSSPAFLDSLYVNSTRVTQDRLLDYLTGQAGLSDQVERDAADRNGDGDIDVADLIFVVP